MEVQQSNLDELLSIVNSRQRNLDEPKNDFILRAKNCLKMSLKSNDQTLANCIEWCIWSKNYSQSQQFYNWDDNKRMEKILQIYEEAIQQLIIVKELSSNDSLLSNEAFKYYQQYVTEEDMSIMKIYGYVISFDLLYMGNKSVACEWKILHIQCKNPLYQIPKVKLNDNVIRFNNEVQTNLNGMQEILSDKKLGKYITEELKEKLQEIVNIEKIVLQDLIIINRQVENEMSTEEFIVTKSRKLMQNELNLFLEEEKLTCKNGTIDLNDRILGYIKMDEQKKVMEYELKEVLRRNKYLIEKEDAIKQLKQFLYKMKRWEKEHQIDATSNQKPPEENFNRIVDDERKLKCKRKRSNSSSNESSMSVTSEESTKKRQRKM